MIDASKENFLSLSVLSAGSHGGIQRRSPVLIKISQFSGKDKNVQIMTIFVEDLECYAETLELDSEGS